MASARIKCEHLAIGDVAAASARLGAPARSAKPVVLQPGGGHPTSTSKSFSKQLEFERVTD